MDIKLKRFSKIRRKLIQQWEKLSKKMKLMKTKEIKIGNKKILTIEFNK